MISKTTGDDYFVELIRLYPCGGQQHINAGLNGAFGQLELPDIFLGKIDLSGQFYGRNPVDDLIAFRQ